MLFVLAFVAALLLLGIAALFSTRGRMTGDLNREGPARIADAMKRRNRVWMIVVVALVVVASLVELFLADYHNALLDLQYDLGGSAFGSADAALGGISWLLYLCVLLGALVGVVFGTIAGLKGYRIADNIRFLDVI